MTYGYNADAAFGNTIVDIIDHARSLLGSSIGKRREDDVNCRYTLGSGDAKAEMLLRSCADL